MAYIKMIDEGEMYFGVGMFCFVGMMISVTLNTMMFDSHAIWEMIGKQREQKNRAI